MAMTREDTPATARPSMSNSDGGESDERDEILRAVARSPLRAPQSALLPGSRWGVSERYPKI
jgi:hypothetical protein